MPGIWWYENTVYEGKLRYVFSSARHADPTDENQMYLTHVYLIYLRRTHFFTQIPKRPYSHIIYTSHSLDEQKAEQ